MVFATQAMLDGIAVSQPQPKIPPELIKFLGKTYNAWQIAIPLLESHVVMFPQDSRCFDALVELYKLVCVCQCVSVCVTVCMHLYVRMYFSVGMTMEVIVADRYPPPGVARWDVPPAEDSCGALTH